MRFILYSEMTVSQCMTALNARMQAKATSSRPQIDGWVDKGGAFAISVSSKVANQFSRRTRMQAKAERVEGVTVIKGVVPDGANRQWQLVIFGGLLLVALYMLASGNALLAIILPPVAAALYIPLMGDHNNHQALLDELQRTLKAKPTPPKKQTKIRATTETRAAVRPTASAAKPGAARPGTAAKPAAKAATGTTRATGTKSAAAKPAGRQY